MIFSRERLRSGSWEDEHANYWISYSDLMAGVLGIFALLLLVTLYGLGKDVEDVRDILEQRKIVIDKLVDRFKQNDEVHVDPQTGVLQFREHVLFDLGSAELKPEGIEALDHYMPTYMEVLNEEDDVRKVLKRIVVEGHADSTFSVQGALPRAQFERLRYEHNLRLSQNRALAVTQHLLKSERMSPYFNDLKEFVSADGRSYIDMIPDDPDGSKSRRIEIRFELKDTELLERVMDRLFHRGVVSP